MLGKNHRLHECLPFEARHKLASRAGACPDNRRSRHNELTALAGAKYARRIDMDLFEEIVRMRRAGERGALATIVHTNGSIPSYESSRMLVREDGSIAGTIGGGCVEAEVWAAAKEVMQAEAAAQDDVQPESTKPNYDAGLICGGTLEIFVEPILPQPIALHFRRRARFDRRVARVASYGRIRHRRGRRPRIIRQPRAIPDGAGDLHQLTKKRSRRSSRTPRATW